MTCVRKPREQEWTASGSVGNQLLLPLMLLYFYLVLEKEPDVRGTLTLLREVPMSLLHLLKYL